MNYFKCFILLLIFAFLQACGTGQKSESVLDQVSGVWKVEGKSTMVTIHVAGNKASMYMADEAIPVTVGHIDEDNKTVNFNVTDNDGFPQIWTLQQVRDESGKSFHLRATLGTTQEDLHFIRRVSADDLNRLKTINRPKAGAAGTVAAAVAAEAGVSSVEPVVGNAPQAPVENEIDSSRFAPSFNCAKASNSAERLICSDRALAAADVDLAQTYNAALECSGDYEKEYLKHDEVSWISTVRNVCSDVSCMLHAYEMRKGTLQQYCPHRT